MIYYLVLKQYFGSFAFQEMISKIGHDEHAYCSAHWWLLRKIARCSCKLDFCSHDKVKEKTPRKKKMTRDAYSNSSLHACESLLSIIMDRKQPGGNTILSLKKSGPQLPRLLTQFSASIAGTGIAVVLSVLCRVACNRLPLCASKILSTGLGLGLVWLSWAVNRLRDTVVSISKTSSKGDGREEEMVSVLDRNLKDIYFRAITLVAVVALKAV